MISIVIVNYRGWFSLIKCLDSLQLLTLTEFSIEVIVIDNFSDDGQFDTVFNKLAVRIKKFGLSKFIYERN